MMTPPSPLINTPLQRGGWCLFVAWNRLSGLQVVITFAAGETAKAVQAPSAAGFTPLKRGVNERKGS